MTEVDHEAVGPDSHPSTAGFNSNHGSIVTTRTEICRACREVKKVTNLIRTPCHHTYCHDCLAQLFWNAVSNDANFPPRCCRMTIPLEPHEPILPEGVISRYREKSAEMSISDRTYCYRPQCSAFIPPRMHNFGTATCEKCDSQTCLACRGPFHSGNCPRDKSLDKLLKVAKSKGWKQCPNCRTMVELTAGCFHVT
ncbi:hypothetical protein F4819DRAFT_460551 [Hypoxylon fuscum]|nr:hypothetical protein F4819DRAFT_460551 [Hypoxylon fuscum]